MFKRYVSKRSQLMMTQLIKIKVFLCGDLCYNVSYSPWWKFDKEPAENTLESLWNITKKKVKKIILDYIIKTN